MDPLSITTAGFAFAGAIGQVAKCIQRIRAIRQAPLEIQLLLEEILDLSGLLDQLDSTQRQRQRLNGTTNDGAEETVSTEAGLEWQMARTWSKLQELDSVLEQHTSKPARFGINHLAWSKIRQRANALRGDLKVLRLNLTASLGANTLVQVDRVVSAIERVNARQDETTKLLTTLVGGSGPQLPLTPPALDFKADALGYTFDLPIKEIQEKASIHRPLEKSSTMTRHQKSITTTGSEAQKDMQVYTRKSTAHCKTWCSCTCHKKRVLRVKQPFTNAFGSFSLAGTGLPWMTASCDEKSCASRSLPSIALTVQFPAWFLKRCLSTSLTYAPAAGPNINIKLPRTVDWTWKLWRYAPEGNLAAIRDLFATGAASPLDVSPLGGSALHYAADHGQFEICKFLIDQGALTNQEDGFNKSPTELAWEKIFSGDLTGDKASSVARMFDDDEFLQTRQFTVLHRIVLGLIPKKLQDELEYSTKDIDAIDSSGRTCVSWAAARGDEKSLEILLQHGADANLPDTQGSTPLHYVRNTACCNLLLIHGANIAASNSYGHTALHAVTRGKGSLPVLETLVKAGVDVNAVDKSGESALCNTTVCIERYTNCVKYLLDNSADMGCVTDATDNLLHNATSYDAHDIMHLLFARGADYTLTNVYGQNILHITARLATSGTVAVLRHYGLARINTKALDHAEKSAMDYLYEREDDSTDPSFRAEFQELVRSIEASQRDTSTLVSELAALDIGKPGTVTCFTPVSADGDDDDEYETLFHGDGLAHGTPVFYDALEQPDHAVPVEILV